MCVTQTADAAKWRLPEFKSQNDDDQVRTKHALLTTVQRLSDLFITKQLQPGIQPCDNSRAVKGLCFERFGSFEIAGF